MKLDTRIAAVVVASALVAGAAFGAFGRPSQAQQPTLPDWITIAGQRCAGMTRPEAIEHLQSWSQREGRRTVILIVSQPTGPRRMWTVPRRVVGASPDLSTMVDEAFRVADAEGWWDRVARWFGRREPVDIKPVWRVDESLTERYVTREVARVVDRPPVNARLRLKNGTLSVVPDRPGHKLDVPASLARTRECLEDHTCASAELPLVSVVPEVTAADAEKVQHELASFSTHFSERGNRRTNLEVACSRIDGVIIRPGGVFSYNDIVGPREAEHGFKLAPVIVRGRMEPGMGGGVCQVSSTVYNAALLAGLEVVARSHHAFPVHYLPAGRDATVVYGAIDLKLRNSTPGPVAFFADASDGAVRVRIFGSEPLPYTVTIERTGISSWGPGARVIRDPTLPVGKSVVRDKGRAGHRVSVWRVFRSNGRVIRRELISRDVYQAFPKVVAVGSAPPPKPSTPSQEDLGPTATRPADVP